MDDPEFKELLGDMLKDDEQAKEAMKGIAQMMQMMGQCFNSDNSTQPTEQEAEQAIQKMMESFQNIEEPEIANEPTVEKKQHAPKTFLSSMMAN